MSVLLSLLIVFVVFLLIYWAVHKLAAAFGAPGLVTTVFDVALVVGFVLYSLSAFGLLSGLR